MIEVLVEMKIKYNEKINLAQFGQFVNRIDPKITKDQIIKLFK